MFLLVLVDDIGLTVDGSTENEPKSFVSKYEMISNFSKLIQNGIDYIIPFLHD